MLNIYWRAINELCTRVALASLLMAGQLVASRPTILLANFQLCKDMDLSSRSVVKTNTKFVCADVCALNPECKAWSFDNEELVCTSFNNNSKTLTTGYKKQFHLYCRLEGTSTQTKEKKLPLPNKASKILVFRKLSISTKIWMFDIPNQELKKSIIIKLKRVSAVTFLKFQKRMLLATRFGQIVSYRPFKNDYKVLVKRIFCRSIDADEDKGFIFGICNSDGKQSLCKMTFDGKNTLSIYKAVKPNSKIVVQSKLQRIYVNMYRKVFYLSYEGKIQGNVGNWKIVYFDIDPNSGYLYYYGSRNIYVIALPGSKQIPLMRIAFTKKGKCQYMYFHGGNLYVIQERGNIGIYTVEASHLKNCSYMKFGGFRDSKALMLTEFY